MIDETENEEQENQVTGQGKKGGDQAGAAGLGKAQVSVAFFDTMKRFGVSMENITRILREWKHLSSEELKKHISDFARDIARASAQLMVSYTTRGFALVTDFLQELSGRESMVSVPVLRTHAPR